VEVVPENERPVWVGRFVDLDPYRSLAGLRVEIGYDETVGISVDEGIDLLAEQIEVEISPT